MRDSNNLQPENGSGGDYKQPSTLELAFHDWLNADSLCEMALFVRVDNSGCRDCSPRLLGIESDVNIFDVTADLSECYLSGDPYSLCLYYSSESREKAEALHKRLLPGGFAVVKGYCQLFQEEDGSMVMMMYPKDHTAVRVLPEELLPVAKAKFLK